MYGLFWYNVNFRTERGIFKFQKGNFQWPWCKVASFKTVAEINRGPKILGVLPSQDLHLKVFFGMLHDSEMHMKHHMKRHFSFLLDLFIYTIYLYFIDW